MNYNSGNFKCPKCGNNKVNSFKNWLSRDEFIKNNTLKTKWIFYQDEKKNGNVVNAVITIGAIFAVTH